MVLLILLQINTHYEKGRGMNDTIKKIGIRLKAARKSAGYRSATAFASEKNIPMSTYSQHEGGKRSINAEMILYYCEQFAIEPGWLLSGYGTPFTADNKDLRKKSKILHDMLEEESDLALDEEQENSLSPIVSDVTRVDVQLYKEILVRLLPLYREDNIQISDKELIDFSVEVYNGIVTTSAAMKDKIAMIELSIASLKRGVIKQKAAEQEQKTA